MITTDGQDGTMLVKAVTRFSARTRFRPMRGLKHHRSARILAAGYALVQNLRCGHYDIATRVPNRH
jgi:hypothetical protein